MKLLHKQEIMECSEFEEGIHQTEVDKILEYLGSLENYKTLVNIKRLDFIAQDKTPIKDEIRLHDIDEIIQRFDIKNGVDYYINNNRLIINSYGQHYEVDNGKEVFHDLVRNQFEMIVLKDNQEINIVKSLEEIIELQLRMQKSYEI